MFDTFEDRLTFAAERGLDLNTARQQDLNFAFVGHVNEHTNSEQPALESKLTEVRDRTTNITYCGE